MRACSHFPSTLIVLRALRIFRLSLWKSSPNLARLSFRVRLKALVDLSFCLKQFGASCAMRRYTLDLGLPRMFLIAVFCLIFFDGPNLNFI